MGRTTLVTGASRRRGIGFAVVRRLADDEDARVVAHTFAPYDATEPWGADADDPYDGLDRVVRLEADLATAGAPEQLVAEAVARVGPLDALVVNHARSQLGGLGELDPATLDATWAVNVRASLLLVQAFAAQYRPGPDGGRVVLFTSGQHRGPMPAEIPYVATKGALHQLTTTLADALIDREITVNTVNPGPTDTGWAGPELASTVSRHMPRDRWNSPQEAADVVGLLLDPASASITGHVVDAEGGFRRSPS